MAGLLPFGSPPFNGGHIRNELYAEGGIAATDSTFKSFSAGLDNFVFNPSFETDATTGIATSGYNLVSGSTVTQNSTQHIKGANSAKVVTAATTQGIVNIFAQWAGGTIYNVAFYVKGDVGGETIAYQICFAGGGFTQTGSTGSLTLTTSWQRVTMNVASQNTNTFGIQINSTTSSTQTFYVDGVQCVPSEVDYPYFDGSSTGYRWSGSTGISPSISSIANSIGADTAFTGTPLNLGPVTGYNNTQGSNTGDKVWLYQNNYGIGLEASTLVLWADPSAAIGIRQTAVSTPYSAGLETIRLNTNGNVSITNTDASTANLILSNAPSQTANYLTANNVSTGPVAWIDSAGDMSSGGNQTNGSESFGAASTAGGQFAAALGKYAAAGNVYSVALGYAASSSADYGLAVGAAASSAGVGAAALGLSASASGDNSFALGRAATTGATHGGSIALGFSATTTASGQFVSGNSTYPITDAYFGSGITYATPSAFTLHGSGAAGSNIAGAAVQIAGGQSTGSGSGGPINFLYSAPGSSGSSLNSLTTGIQITSGNVITTPTTSLTLQQTGDVFGASYLKLLSRNGSNGALFGSVNLDLVDFAFLPNSGVQSNIRLEHRSGILINSSNSDGEFQYLNSTANQYFSAGASSITVNNGTHFGINVTNPAALLSIVSNNAGVVVSYIQGAASQTSNLTNWLNSSTTPLAWVSANGTMSSGGNQSNFSEAFGAGATTGSANSATALGSGATGTGAYSTAVGISSTATGDLSTVLGAFANNANNSSSIAIGVNAANTAAQQLVIGSALGVPITDAYIGSGVVNAAPTATTFHATGGSGTNIQGADLNIASGQGTGSATGGTINFQASAAGSSGTTLRSLNTVAYITPAGALNATGTISASAGGAAQVLFGDDASGNASLEFGFNSTKLFQTTPGTLQLQSSGSVSTRLNILANAAQASDLQQWQNSSGVSQSGIDKNGNIYVLNNTVSNPGFYFKDDPTTGIGYIGSVGNGNILLYQDNIIALALSTAILQFRVPSNFEFSWSSATSNTMAADTGLSRNSTAALVSVGNGTSGDTSGGMVMSSIRIIASPTSGYILTSDSSGNGTWAAPTYNGPTASASVSLTAGTAYQNTTGKTQIISGIIAVTAAVSGTVTLGMGATSTPTSQAISGTLSASTTLPFTARVPNNYYLLISSSGTITLGSITAIAT